MQSLIAELEHVARHDATRLHSVQGEERLTFGEFVEATHQVAHALRQSGIMPGDPVAVWSRNDHRMLQVIYGALRSKAMFVPLNARNSVEENLKLLRRFEVRALFFQSGVLDTSLLKDVSSLRLAVPFDTEPSFECSFVTWRDSTKDLGRFPDEFISGEDPAAIFPTSGTTGEPRGVVHSHLTLTTMARGYRDVLSLPEAAKHLVVAPVTHVAGGLVYATTGQGCTQYLLASTQSSDILDAIEREQANVIFAPPTLLYGMLDEQQRQPRNIKSLQRFMYAGSPITPGRLKQAMKVFGPILVNVYSQSEVLYPITSLSRDNHSRIADGDEHLLTSCGKPTTQGEVSVMDDEGRHLAAGEIGEIVTRSLAGIKHFLRDEEATLAIRTFGWHHTGDVGRLDEEGFLYIVDRKKDMIISGGFNVYSAEVESVLQEHPSVREAAVIGLPDPKWGETVCAVVVAHPGEYIDIDALRAFCRDKIGAVKAPKVFKLYEALPKNATGKVLKRYLRDAVSKDA